LFSVVPVCDFVCLSVNTITPEPLEVSYRILGATSESKREAKFKNGNCRSQLWIIVVSRSYLREVHGQLTVQNVEYVNIS